MSFRRRLKGRQPPEGWDMIENVIDDFEQQIKEAVNAEHTGLRKNEATWRLHRLNYEKSRFVYDLYYTRKAISRELFDWLVREKVVDGPLIAKWRKPGYEILCSMLAIQKSNHNFGTTSHCRVPMRVRAPQQRVTPNVHTGCVCCASGDGKFGGPIWWNTPLDDDTKEKAEENRAVWVQEGEEGDDQEQQQQANDDNDGEQQDGGEAGPSGGSRKRPLPAGSDDELDDDVKQRLAKLKQGME